VGCLGAEVFDLECEPAFEFVGGDRYSGVAADRQLDHGPSLGGGGPRGNGYQRASGRNERRRGKNRARDGAKEMWTRQVENAAEPQGSSAGAMSDCAELAWTRNRLRCSRTRATWICTP
jgi:hypothetical protein